MRVVHFRASKLVAVGRSIFSEEFLANLARTRGAFVVAGPLRIGDHETCEFLRIDDEIRKAVDVLETGLSARSSSDKDRCIRAAQAALGKASGPLLAADAMEASLSQPDKIGRVGNEARKRV